MLFEDTYYTIGKTGNGHYRDRGSRFLAYAFPASTEEEIREQLKLLKKEMYDATHHCYAWVLGFDKSASRVSDDGEPSGSAGRPIHGQIQSLDLTQVHVVVVRYYGGIKLGVPGLIQAYRTAARDALDDAGVVEKIVMDQYLLRFNYESVNSIMTFIKEHELELLQSKFDLDCELSVAIRHGKSEMLTQLLRKRGKISIQYLKSV